MDANTAKTGFVTFVVAGLAIAGLAVTHQAAELDKEGRIVLATGPHPHYQDLAARYREDLKKFGVKLEIQPITEGFATLRALADNNSGVTAGFVKGGLVGSLQGRLATEKAKGRHVEYSNLRSVGRLFYEPIWVFTRGDLPLESLRDLKGKRILTGTREGGTRRIANMLLKANGVDRNNAKLEQGELSDDASELFADKVDAAFLVLPADSDKIQKLLRVGNIRLMDFTPEAEAYINRFPALTKVVLRQGAVEFNPLIPTDDITLLSTAAALVVRPDMQPALVSLLTHAVIANPRPSFDSNGDPVLFYKAGEFPSANDPEFQVPNDAKIVYKSGELPFVLRHLAPINQRMGVPFSYSSFASDHAAKLVLLIPILAVLLPLGRAIPAIYVWTIRRRLMHWYRQLKKVENDLDSGKVARDSPAVHAEIERIDQHVRKIWVPLYFSNQLYDLRGHIELVRQRIASRMVPQTRMAAE
jgi:TRAP-type uncharacterized transport system substrate-binding protein